METFLKVFFGDIVRSLTSEKLWAFLSDKVFRGEERERQRERQRDSDSDDDDLTLCRV